MRAITSLLALSFLACGAPARQNFKVVMQSQTDDGRLLEGVEVFHGRRSLGKTTTSGQLDVTVDAIGGSTLEVRFICPDGYAATRDNVLVPLRSAMAVANAQKQTTDYSITLECRPQKRNGVLVVNANMANVPVKIGQRLLGRTNSHGVAYLAVNLAPKEVFEVSLDTSSNPHLRPRNPRFPFVMPAHDEVFVVEESFRVETPPPPPPKKKKKKKKPVVEKKKRPVRIYAGESQWGAVKPKN